MPVDAVERVGEVAGQGICGGDGAGAGAEGCYGASMGDDWRVCIARDDLRELMSEQALTGELMWRLGHEEKAGGDTGELIWHLGYQVKVDWDDSQFFWYADSVGWADEIAQVAREVLARHDVSAPVRTQRWSRRDRDWRDVTDVPAADIAAELQAEHEYFQDQERERSRRAGFPAWRVRVDVPSHRDVVALAGHLAAQGWGVRRRRRHLFVGANCEDDAKGLIEALSGDGRADAETAFRVRRVSYSYMLVAPFPDGGPG